MSLRLGSLVFLLVADKPWTVELPPGKPLKIHHFVAIYEWWAAADKSWCLSLFSGRPRDGGLDLLALRETQWLPEEDTPRWFWPLVIAAMALTTFWGIQRLPQSLWDDEDSSLHRAVLGQYRRDETGDLKLKETTWKVALWNYWKPANHQLQTILSKASLQTWRAIARPTGLQFTEPVVRFPCLIAGILSIGSIALLLKRLGFARAGVLAAFVLAIHPWHVRYAIELRGYIFTLLFGPLMIYCLHSGDRLLALEVVGWIRRVGVRPALRLSRLPLHGRDRESLRCDCAAPAAFDCRRTCPLFSAIDRGERRRPDGLPPTDASLRPTAPRLLQNGARSWRARVALASKHGCSSARWHPLEQLGPPSGRLSRNFNGPPNAHPVSVRFDAGNSGRRLPHRRSGADRIAAPGRMDRSSRASAAWSNGLSMGAGTTATDPAATAPPVTPPAWTSAASGPSRWARRRPRARRRSAPPHRPPNRRADGQRYHPTVRHHRPTDHRSPADHQPAARRRRRRRWPAGRRSRRAWPAGNRRRTCASTCSPATAARSAGCASPGSTPRAATAPTSPSTSSTPTAPS